MGKLDTSDCAGKCRRRHCLLTFNYGLSLLITKKYLVLGTCITMATILILLYCDVWDRDSLLWYRNGEPNTRAKNMDSFLQTNIDERPPYDQLMQYMLHPQAPCRTSEVLGGKVRGNGLLDGDKVVCLDPGQGISKECIAYSFGNNNEWSFDEDMHRRFGCNVYSFDPSMGMNDHLHSEGVWFYNLGIGKDDEKVIVRGKEWNKKSFDSILRQLGHQNKTIDVLKLDIEGAELVVMEDILNKGLLNHVNHLCIEIHLQQNPYWTRVLNLLKRIESEAGLHHFSTLNNTQVPKLRVPGFPSRYEQLYFEVAWYRL